MSEREHEMALMQGYYRYLKLKPNILITNNITTINWKKKKKKKKKKIGIKK